MSGSAATGPVICAGRRNRWRGEILRVTDGETVVHRQSRRGARPSGRGRARSGRGVRGCGAGAEDTGHGQTGGTKDPGRVTHASLHGRHERLLLRNPLSSLVRAAKGMPWPPCALKTGMRRSGRGSQLLTRLQGAVPRLQSPPQRVTNMLAQRFLAPVYHMVINRAVDAGKVTAGRRRGPPGPSAPSAARSRPPLRARDRVAGAAYAPRARVLTVSRSRAANGSGPGQRGQHSLAAWPLESRYRTTNPDSGPSLLVCTNCAGVYR
jgi:hypothetical protein